MIVSVSMATFPWLRASHTRVLAWTLVVTLSPMAAFGQHPSAPQKGAEDDSQPPLATLSTKSEAVPAKVISLLGAVLSSPEPSPESLANLDAAKRNFDEAPTELENIIWYGRRMAYTGNYHEAIRIYTAGLDQFPDEPRLYRHRGHRLITVRNYEAAIADFERGLELIQGTEDEIEQDGLPNAMNIPVSSLHSNIRYHLGLAYYLTGQFERAVDIYRKDLAAALNDDQVVSTTHWLVMALRRLGRGDEAGAALDRISDEMEVIENHAYHQLCLLYQGRLAVEELLNDTSDDPTSAATLYGAANWFDYSGDHEKADELLRRIVDQTGWAAFGHAAAEADLARSTR